MPRHADAIVIGGGPGGYVAAIRLGQLGKQVVLVEKARLGGICLNEGCIPSKALITAGRLMHKIKEAHEIGIEVSGLKLDFAKTQAWKNRVVQRLNAGIKLLCDGNGVETLQGTARLKPQRRVSVERGGDVEEIEAERIVIATGSRPIALKEFPFDGRRILDSTQALELDAVPPRLLVIGGGVTGLEIAGMYLDFASRVTIAEMMDQVLPGLDRDLVEVVQNSLVRKGAEIYLEAQATLLGASDGRIQVRIRSRGKEVEGEYDKILVAVGRAPNTDHLGLLEAGVELGEKGFIKVDAQRRTTAEGIYAIGDAAGPPFLAHKASREGLVAAEAICGRPAAFDQRALPNAIFTDPEVASVGLSESEAKRSVGECLIEKFPFQASGRALTERETSGYVKIICDPQRSRILGVHIVGPNASDLISEAALAIEMGATPEDIALTIHPHPTLPEALMEAAEAVTGAPIHILKRS